LSRLCGTAGIFLSYVTTKKVMKEASEIQHNGAYSCPNSTTVDYKQTLVAGKEHILHKESLNPLTTT